MQTRIDGRDGWIEVVRDGIHLLAKGDASLAERVTDAVAGAEDDDLADVVTDELSAGGVRRTPDFALIDEASGRVLVRGAARVVVTAGDGTTHTVSAPARGPWADEDLQGEVADVVLATGEPEPEDGPEDSAPAVPAVADESMTDELHVDEPPTDEAGPLEVTPQDDAEAEAAAVPEPTDTVDPAEAADEAAHEPAAEMAVAPAPAAPAPEVGPEDAEPAAGWAMPSVFGREPAPATQAPTDQQPIEEAEVVETPAPVAEDLVADEPETAPDAQPEAPQAPVAGQAAGAASDEDDELPSFDFLFGNTHRHRSSLMGQVAEDEAAADAPIDSGPVAAAGGFQPHEDQVNATLAPPTEDDGDHAPTPSGPTVDDHGGLPPMPGSAPFAEDADDDNDVIDPAGSEPAADVPVPVPGPGLGGPGRVQAARDDAPGHEPGSGRPQFADGHLVGSRVPTAGTGGAAPVGDSAPLPAPSGPETPDRASEDSSGVISAVPWGDSAPAAGPGPGMPGMPGMPFGLPSLPTPDAGASQPAPAQPAPEQESEADAASPMVLAVRCSVGHLNAPHATRCRVCGQDLPSQQPEQTTRPALGQLRMSTGDVVTLDRGVLIGRAPRAVESGPSSPHLVRISSPDNEISRNHVEIVLDGWHVLVRDLGSTNGTTVALPGSSPVRVRPGDQQTIEPGTTITLADQVSMVFEVTG